MYVCKFGSDLLCLFCMSVCLQDQSVQICLQSEWEQQRCPPCPFQPITDHSPSHQVARASCHSSFLPLFCVVLSACERWDKVFQWPVVSVWLTACLSVCLSHSGSPQVLSPSMSGPPNVQPRRSSRLFTSASSTAKVEYPVPARCPDLSPCLQRYFRTTSNFVSLCRRTVRS